MESYYMQCNCNVYNLEYGRHYIVQLCVANDCNGNQVEEDYTINIIENTPKIIKTGTDSCVNIS